MSEKRHFRKVGTSIWGSQRFQKLPDDRSRLAYLYMLTAPHCNSIGAYRLPVQYMAADLDIETKEAKKILQNISDAGLIRYDFDERIIALSNWFEFNAISNRKHLAGALAAHQELPVHAGLTTSVLFDIAVSTRKTISNWSSEKVEAISSAIKMVQDQIIAHQVRVGQSAWITHIKGIDDDTLNVVQENFNIDLSIGLSHRAIKSPKTKLVTETETETETKDGDKRRRQRP